MDITKIEEARKLFSLLEDTEQMHKLAIKEFIDLANGSFHFMYLNYWKFKESLEKTINTHFEELKEEIKKDISKL